MKKAGLIIGIIVILTLLGVGLFNYTDLLGATVQNLYAKPLFGRLDCQPTDSYEGKERIVMPKEGTSVYCGMNENTDECRIYIDSTETPLWSGSIRFYYKICNNDGTNCASSFTESPIIQEGTKDTLIIPSLKEGKKIFGYCEDRFTNINLQCEVIKEYKPWKLYRYVGGAKYEAKADNCQLNAISGTDKNKILKEDYSSTCCSKKGGEGTKWVNYVYDWALGINTNVVNHPNYGMVYCLAPNVYEIIKVETAGGQLKQIDPVYSINNQDVQLNGLGSIKGKVECCPSEPNCDPKTFKFKTGTIKECAGDIDCYNAGNPVAIDGKNYVLNQCINGKCKQSSPISVQCTSTSFCPNGQICDLTPTNYGKCIQQIGSGCGDGICDSRVENNNNCQIDCPKENKDITCNFLQDKVITNTMECQGGFFTQTLCYVGLKAKTPVTTESCQTSGWVYLVILLLFVSLIVYIVKGKKRRK